MVVSSRAIDEVARDRHQVRSIARNRRWRIDEGVVQNLPASRATAATRVLNQRRQAIAEGRVVDLEVREIVL